ncbi:MAG TPA: hypothetical protein VJ963_06905, partial [Bacteroidales bacterium]|nr:hypothetical protein [Bacteroidales bacterium]
MVSCSPGDHISFENIPVDGKLDAFTNELLSLGFIKQKSYEENLSRVSGTYCGKNCVISVFATPETKSAYKVVVNFQKEPHDSVKVTYQDLNKRCASIYGKGASIYQQFHNSPRFLFNEPKLIREPRPGDYTRYLTRSGTIILEVRLDYLSVTYIDKSN